MRALVFGIALIAACTLAPRIHAQEDLILEKIPAKMYIIPERMLCRGSAPFKDCREFRKTKGRNEALNKFLRTLERKNYFQIEFDISAAVSSDVNKTLFRGIREHFNNQSSENAAFLILDFSSHNPDLVEIRREYQGEDAASFDTDKPTTKARDPGDRVVDFYNASSIDPEAGATFIVTVDSKVFEFYFSY